MPIRQNLRILSSQENWDSQLRILFLIYISYIRSSSACFEKLFVCIPKKEKVGLNMRFDYFVFDKYVSNTK